MHEARQTGVDRVRVIGIFAHVDAGKTTTSEAMLYYTGRIHRVGSVDEGSTQLDWMPQERERGITVTSAATTCDWTGHRINLIDTPGHIDFSAEVVRSIRVIDGAVILLCGVGGVEPQTEAVWMHADHERLPRIIFVNKLDRTGADFGRVLTDIRERLTPHAVPVQIPVGIEGSFQGVVELIDRQALLWADTAAEPARGPVPEALHDDVEAARDALLDAVCELDEVLLAERISGREPDRGALLAALRRATIDGALVPVLCGSAHRRIGVQALLNAVVAYLPSPRDVAGQSLPAAPRAAQADAGRDALNGPFCAAAFKIVTDPYIGHLTWVRVYAGRLVPGATVCNVRTDDRERVGRIYRMHGNQREQIDSASAGDVVALVGIRSAITGDALCEPGHRVELRTFTFPDPVIMVALTMDSDRDADKLHACVARLCREDPTLIGQFDAETGEQTLAGMGELHLEIAVDRLRTESGVAPRVSQPRIAYRETVGRAAELAHAYVKQSGGHGHFAKVHLRVEPLARGQGFVFENACPPSELPSEFVRPVELGVREALAEGVAAGYPVTDLRVTLLGGKAHEVDSSGKDFSLAGAMTVRRALKQAQPLLLEPVMQIDINAAEEHVGAVTGDLGRRRGQVKSVETRGHVRHLSGEVPLAEVRGYATDLRSLTQGRATFVLEFSRYDRVPATIAEQIVRERQSSGAIRERF
ncbi:MAG: elongation factor G [Kiritimatiellae bacterium]|nr:elongation factor G [Kiritimatiellia bacterium]